MRIQSWSRFVAVVAAVAVSASLTLAAPKAMTAGTAEAKPAAEKPVKAAADKLDINSASKADLAKLPGIGDAYSQKIIDGRPYKTKAELESKKILPKGVYNKIASLIIAKQAK
jgi:competence protein ComEA